MSAAQLYTPELLALATSLADYPLDDRVPLRGDARSASCGSTLTIGLALDEQGAVSRIGLRAHACAVGQAAAAIFAGAASGRDAADLAEAAAAIEVWLRAEGAAPTWPGFAPLLPARDFPGRQGALMLPWKAALAALPSAVVPG